MRSKEPRLFAAGKIKMNFIIKLTFVIVLSLLSSCKDKSTENSILSRKELEVFDISFDNFDLALGIKEQSGNTVSYKISMPELQYELLVIHTKSKGYSDWQKGEIHYGHINLGFGLHDNVVYSTKYSNDHALVLCYDKVNRCLYLIKFKN